MRICLIQKQNHSLLSDRPGPTLTTCHVGADMSITAINVRNQFRGKVKEIIEGPVVSEIDVETPSGLIVTSVITTRSVRDLGLVPGKEVIALVKSTEVSIAAL